MPYVYMVYCEGGSVYTGLAHDIEKRMREHAACSSACAKYTRMHPVRSLAVLWKTEDHRAAARLEYRIKDLTRKEKDRLIADPSQLYAFFPELTEHSYEWQQGVTMESLMKKQTP